MIELDGSYAEAAQLFATWIAEAEIRGVYKAGHSNIPLTILKDIVPTTEWRPGKVPRRPAA
jgi:hypothetical protein